MKLETIGIAKKVIAAVGAQLIALVTTWIASGEFDRVEWAQLAAVALTVVFGVTAPPNATRVTVKRQRRRRSR